MSNIISTQNKNNINPIYFGNTNRENKSRFIEAPVYIPKYSLDKELQEKDEFRKNAIMSLKLKQQDDEKNHWLLKGLFVISAIAGFIFLEVKKII